MHLDIGSKGEIGLGVESWSICSSASRSASMLYFACVVNGLCGLLGS